MLERFFLCLPVLSLATKLKLFNVIVTSVILLHGCESWKGLKVVEDGKVRFRSCYLRKVNAKWWYVRVHKWERTKTQIGQTEHRLKKSKLHAKNGKDIGIGRTIFRFSMCIRWENVFMFLKKLMLKFKFS